MDLGIVIVSYNTRDLLRDCLASVYASLDRGPLSAHVLVVDNASSDGSAGMVASEFPQATLIASPENLGFAAGSNRGTAALCVPPDPPRHILLLNPDTIVQGDALHQMVAFLDATPNAGAAGAQLAYGDGGFQHGAFHFPSLPMAFFDFWTINHRLIDSRLNGRYPRRLYEAGTPFRIDHPLGAALMMRVTALDAVGPLDEGYFMYCEEIDWCIRARRAGWGTYCVPRARIVHLAGQSTAQFRDRMYVALWRSRYRLFEKHYSRLYGMAVRGVVRVGLARRTRRVRRALARGEIDAAAAERQLAAYRAVGEM